MSLVVDAAGSRGLVAVRDNGVGMAPRELGDWAVMNLGMEDRGLVDGPAARAAAAAPAGGRYLSGDISFFGVGSKNAAFYLGRTVKVVTRPASAGGGGGDGSGSGGGGGSGGSGSGTVHELCIRGDELERRFRAGEAVYEEDMVHRPPGHGAAAAAPADDVEAGFAPAAAWLAEEAAAAPGGGDGGAGGFTRVVVGDLKPDALAALADEGAALGVLRDLAHLYHYYLHGPKGNAFMWVAFFACGCVLWGVEGTALELV